jgi:hypothetical protein
MRKIVRIIKTVAESTKPYDVPADHAFSRQSIEEQKAVGIAGAEAEAKEAAKRPDIAQPFNPAIKPA